MFLFLLKKILSCKKPPFDTHTYSSAVYYSTTYNEMLATERRLRNLLKPSIWRFFVIKHTHTKFWWIALLTSLPYTTHHHSHTHWNKEEGASKQIWCCPFWWTLRNLAFNSSDSKWWSSAAPRFFNFWCQCDWSNGSITRCNVDDDGGGGVASSESTQGWLLSAALTLHSMWDHLVLQRSSIPLTWYRYLPPFLQYK